MITFPLFLCASLPSALSLFFFFFFFFFIIWIVSLMLISQEILSVEKNGRERETHRELSSSLSDDHQFD